VLYLFVMNFTGQYQKSRTINLGGRNASKTGRDSILRKAREDRERRERLRKEEKAAIKIQSFYRGRMDVWRRRNEFLQEWNYQYSDQNSVSSQYDLMACVREFQFCLRADSRIVERLLLIMNAKRQLLAGLPNQFYENLFNSLATVVEREGDTQPWEYALKIGLILNSHAVYPLSWVYAIGRLLVRVQNRQPNQLISQTVARLVPEYPLTGISQFLSVPNVFSVCDRNSFTELVPAAVDLSAHIDVDQLTPDRKMWMVANFVPLVQDSFTMNSLHLLTQLLVYLDLTIVELVDEGSDSEEDAEQNQTGNVYYVSVNDRSPQLTQIGQLYERSFTNSVFRLLAAEHTTVSINVLATLYVSLIRLFPRRRKDLMLYLSLVSESSAVHIFWQSFKQSVPYSCTIRSTMSSDDLAKLCTYESDWTMLILTLELYSYWLIVADDSEFLENASQGMSLQQVEDLAALLKNLCCSLIWNWHKVDRVSRSIDELFSKLKNVSLLVIRQIYIRDSRRPFLGKDFWLMTNIIDMELFIPAVVEEEERLQESLQNPDSDEEMEQQLPNRATSTMKNTIAPRLEILKQVPFFMPFEVRVHIFQAFIELDRVRTQQSTPMVDFFGNMPRIKADIHREHLLEDAYREFNNAGSSFKFPIGVTFYSQGIPEAGIDGGGLTKEFLTSVCQEGFSLTRGLFRTTNDHLLYPNPVFGVAKRHSELSEAEVRQGLAYIEFLGQVIGKCLYSGILVDVEFAPFFLLKWAGRVSKNSFDDLYSLDPEMYNGLVKVHKYTGDVENDLNLNFVMVDNVGHGVQKSIELKHGGVDVPVTNNNRLEYIHSIANYKLNTVLAAQTNAFLRGVSKVISLNWLSMFNAMELQMLISGGAARIDVDDLIKNTVYGGYSERDKTITYFWEVLREFPEEDKREFVKFVTSVTKAPLLGFSQLQPKFAIRRAGDDRDRLPTSATCVNMLKLPDYHDKRLLKEKLLYAIRSGAGFDLS
jgi:ubiquitin-protein ligase E3 C